MAYTVYTESYPSPTCPSCSLADLCNFGGVDYESGSESEVWLPGHRSASLSSDASAFSCVSVLPTEELDRLLEDVRSLDDSSLQVPAWGVGGWPRPRDESC